MCGVALISRCAPSLFHAAHLGCLGRFCALTVESHCGFCVLRAENRCCSFLLAPVCAVTWFAMERKYARSLRSLAVSCKCGRSTFPALHFVCPCSFSLCLYCDALLLLCAAPDCLAAASQVGRCPTLCKGHCPLTPQAFGKGLTETFNALRVWVYSFVRPRRFAFFCPTYSALSASTALHGAPSLPPRFIGCDISKYLPSSIPLSRMPSNNIVPAPKSIKCTSFGASSGPTV